MIRLNTIYRTKDKYHIVIIQNLKTNLYELYHSLWKPDLEDFDYLLNECNPLYASYTLSEVRHFARKIIDGEYFN